MVSAVALWRKYWSDQLVCVHVDNISVVQILNSGSSKEPSGVAMHLLHCLAFFSAHFQFAFKALHVPGSCNIIVDMTSRNKHCSLFTQGLPFSLIHAPSPQLCGQCWCWSLQIGAREGGGSSL